MAFTPRTPPPTPSRRPRTGGRTSREALHGGPATRKPQAARAQDPAQRRSKRIRNRRTRRTGPTWSRGGQPGSQHTDQNQTAPDIRLGGVGSGGGEPGMTNLAVWRVEEPEHDQAGEDAPPGPSPSSVERSHLGSEKQFEDWIATDVTLVGGGLTIVGRQVGIDDGILDLLAIDSRDRWVVIELKAGTLHPGALEQALGYASSLAQLSADDVLAKLEPGLTAFGDAEMLSARLKQLLELERDGGVREISMMLVGVGVSPRIAAQVGVPRPLRRAARSRQLRGVPAAGGPQLLIREVIEDRTSGRPRPRPHPTLDAIRRRADAENVLEPFNRFVRMSDDAGLVVRPFKLTVMSRRRRTAGGS